MFFFLAPIKWAIKLVMLAVFAAVIYVIVSGVQVVQASGGTAASTSPAPVAIVVSGTAALGQTNPDPDLVGRLQQTLALYQAHAAPVIVVAGPAGGTGGRSIPTASKNWLVSKGVPASSIEQVVSSSSSEFAAVANVVGAGGEVIVVTDAVDALWAKDLASRAGLHASVSPVPGSKKLFFLEFGPLLREATGVAAGRIIGYGRVSWAVS